MHSHHVVAVAVVVALGSFTACQNQLTPDDDHGDAAAAGAFEVFDAAETEQAMVRSCKPNQTLKGIDVSYYQERINWSSVKAAGVDYAFIRVSDGSTFVDPRFQENWRGARQAGVKRGAYQFFRSNKDPIVQANLLLDTMGPLQDGDLPPVIDVESTDGQPRATIVAKVQRWVDRVEAVLGVKPIIYTGPYFWQDQVGSSAFGGHPLWIAHYGTDCPLIPAPWSRYTFHQFTDSGRINGISGNVDTNTFAGTRADLEALSFHGGQPQQPSPPSETCEKIPAGGRVVDDEDACFFAGGPTEFLLAESGEGFDGGLIWTHATDGSARDNWGEWTLRMDQAGRYKISVWTDSSVATSQLTRYRVEHDGITETAQIDQRAIEGWRSLGTFQLGAGGARVVLNDNTGEAMSTSKRIVLDALKIEPASDQPPPPAASCTQVRVRNADSLNVRPSASTSQSPIGALRNNDVVDKLSSVEGQSVNGNRTWHRIQKGNLRGYVSAYYTTCVN